MTPEEIELIVAAAANLTGTIVKKITGGTSKASDIVSAIQKAIDALVGDASAAADTAS